MLHCATYINITVRLLACVPSTGFIKDINWEDLGKDLTLSLGCL